MVLRTISLFLIMAAMVTAQGITLSKDTCVIKTPPGASVVYDTLLFTNTGPEPVSLDSARVEFEDLDTARFMHEPPYLRMTEVTEANIRNTLVWELDSLNDGVFRCIINTTYGASKEVLSMGPSGDSVKVSFVFAGTCIMCAAIHPLPFSRGILRLYYSSGQIIKLHLIYDDPRVPICRFVEPLHLHKAQIITAGTFLINGRCVPQQTAIRNRVRIRHILIAEGRREGLLRCLDKER